MNTLIAVSGLGIFCLLAEIINLRKAIVPVSVVALLAILGLTISEFNHPASWYYNMIVVSNFSVAFSSLFIVLTVFLILMSGDYYKDKHSDGKMMVPSIQDGRHKEEEWGVGQ